jgi:hypothetical protein
VTCRHCGEPVERCTQHTHGNGCAGWRHSRSGSHVCYVPCLAEPGPGRLALVVHLITPSFDLACGHDGHDRSSSVLAEVTCPACKGIGPGPSALQDICEAIDGPDAEWYREVADNAPASGWGR